MGLVQRMERRLEQLGHLVLPRGLATAAGDRLDVLINNAGTVEVGPLAGQEDAAISRLIETNLTAPILVTRDLLPAIRRAQGRVVNVGSVFGDIAYPYFAAYSASKFGLRGFPTRCAASGREKLDMGRTWRNESARSAESGRPYRGTIKTRFDT
ncbi:hypothetical protein CNY89_14815, partial [Amaricoccus sp. HAR-UPW-R2A-40]